MPELVMMEGPPGAGKSTLAEILVERLSGIGRPSALVPEEAIFESGAFAEVGRAFKTKQWPGTALMLAAYAELFERAAGDLVFDWNAVGMIEDLPCANPNAVAPTGNDPAALPDAAILAGHADAVHRLWPGSSTLLVLDVPAETAIARATSERGESWTERELARLPDGVTIVEFQRSLDVRRRGIVNAYETAGWIVVRLDASRDPTEISETALAAVSGLTPEG